MRGTKIRVNQGLIRPILVAGVERKALMLYGTVCLCLILSTRFRMPEALIGIGLLVVIHLFFTRVSRKDPQIIELYNRHNRYRQGYFPARTAVMRGEEKVRPTILVGRSGNS